MHYEIAENGKRILVQTYREARDHDGNQPPWTDPIPRMIRHANADGLSMIGWCEDPERRRYIGIVIASQAAEPDPQTSALVAEVLATPEGT